MKLIHNILYKNKENILLEQILKDGYLKSSIKTKNKISSLRYKCNYFNIYIKDIKFDCGISLIFNKELLVNKEFYMCYGQNFETCYNDFFKLKYTSLNELSKFKKNILKKILNLVNNNIQINFDDISVVKRLNYNKMEKNKMKFSYESLYSMSHEVLIEDDISLDDYLEEIIFNNKPKNKIINLIKEKYPKVKISINI